MGVLLAECDCYRAAHGSAGHEGFLPTMMIHQICKIICEKTGRVGDRAAYRCAVSAAVEYRNLTCVREHVSYRTPEFTIHRERMGRVRYDDPNEDRQAANSLSRYHLLSFAMDIIDFLFHRSGGCIDHFFRGRGDFLRKPYRPLRRSESMTSCRRSASARKSLSATILLKGIAQGLQLS